MKRCNRSYFLFICMGLLVFPYCMHGMLSKGLRTGTITKGGKTPVVKIRRNSNRGARRKFEQQTGTSAFKIDVERPVENFVPNEKPISLALFEMNKISNNVKSERLLKDFEVELKKIKSTDTELENNFITSLVQVTKEIAENHKGAPLSQGISQKEFAQEIISDDRIQLLFNVNTDYTNVFATIIQSFVLQEYQLVRDSYVKEQELKILVEGVAISETGVKKVGKKISVRPAIKSENLIEISLNDPGRFLRLEETGKIGQLIFMPGFERDEMLRKIREEYPSAQDRITARIGVNTNIARFFQTGLSQQVENVLQKIIINRNPIISTPEVQDIARTMDLSVSFNAINQGIKNNIPVEGSDEAIHLFLSYGLAVYDISPLLIAQAEKVNPLYKDFFSRDFQSIKTVNESGAISSIVIKRPTGGLVMISDATTMIPCNKSAFEQTEKNFWGQSVEAIIKQATQHLFGEKKEALLLETPEEGRFEEILEEPHQEEPRIVEVREEKPKESMILEQEKKSEQLRKEELQFIQKSEQERLARLEQETRKKEQEVQEHQEELERQQREKEAAEQRRLQKIEKEQRERQKELMREFEKKEQETKKRLQELKEVVEKTAVEHAAKTVEQETLKKEMEKQELAKAEVFPVKKSGVTREKKYEIIKKIPIELEKEIKPAELSPSEGEKVLPEEEPEIEKKLPREESINIEPIVYVEEQGIKEQELQAELVQKQEQLRETKKVATRVAVKDVERILASRSSKVVTTQEVKQIPIEVKRSGEIVSIEQETKALKETKQEELLQEEKKEKKELEEKKETKKDEKHKQEGGKKRPGVPPIVPLFPGEQVSLSKESGKKEVIKYPFPPSKLGPDIKPLLPFGPKQAPAQSKQPLSTSGGEKAKPIQREVRGEGHATPSRFPSKTSGQQGVSEGSSKEYMPSSAYPSRTLQPVSSGGAAGGPSGATQGEGLPIKTLRPLLWALLAFLLSIIVEIIKRRYFG